MMDRIHIPRGCVRRPCVHLIVAGLTTDHSLMLRAAEQASLVGRGLLALGVSAEEATKRFEDLAARLPHKIEDFHFYEDKVDKKGRKQSNTPFYHNVPKRRR